MEVYRIQGASQWSFGCVFVLGSTKGTLNPNPQGRRAEGLS